MHWGGNLDIYTEHPDYAENKDFFDLTNDAFFGLNGFINGDRLIEYPREMADEIEDRKEVAYYVNRMKAYLQIPVDTIFGQKNFYRKNPGDYHKTIRSAFGNWQQTWKQAALLAELFGGTSFVGFDRNKVEIKTELDRMNNPLYLNLFSARMVPDWSLKKDGSFNWIKIYEQNPDRGDFKNPKASEPNLRVWTDEEWFLFTKLNGTPVEIDSGPNTFGRVPIQPFFQQPKVNEGIYTNFDAGHMAKIQHRMYNTESEIVLSLRQSCFNTLTIATPDGLLPAGVDIGPRRFIAHPPDGSVDYIAPSNDPVIQLYNHLKECDQAMQVIMKIDKEGLKVITAAQVHYLTEQASKSIRSFSLQGQETELALTKMMVEADGLSGEVITKWPEEFTRNVLSAQTIDNFIKLNSTLADLPEEFGKRAKLEFIKSIDPNTTPEMLKQYKDQLDQAMSQAVANHSEQLAGSAN